MDRPSWRMPRREMTTGSSRLTAPSRQRVRRRNWRRMLVAWVRMAALSLLLLIVAAILVASLLDIARQIILSNRDSKAADVSITFGTYITVILIGIGIIIKRAVSSKNVLSSIPKGYVPTQATDVPKRAYGLISAEYDRASVIARISQPKGRAQEGWGRPGTQNENVHFRTAILSTIPVLHSTLSPLFPEAYQRGKACATNASRTGPLSPLAPLLSLEASSNPIPDALLPLVNLYEQHLQDAQYGSREPDERQWDEVVKIVAVFVGVLGNHAVSNGAT